MLQQLVVCYLAGSLWMKQFCENYLHITLLYFTLTSFGGWLCIQNVCYQSLEVTDLVSLEYN